MDTFRKLEFDWLIPATNLHSVDSSGPDIPSAVITYVIMEQIVDQYNFLL